MIGWATARCAAAELRAGGWPRSIPVACAARAVASYPRELTLYVPTASYRAVVWAVTGLLDRPTRADVTRGDATLRAWEVARPRVIRALGRLLTSGWTVTAFEELSQENKRALILSVAPDVLAGLPFA